VHTHYTVCYFKFLLKRARMCNDLLLLPTALKHHRHSSFIHVDILVLVILKLSYLMARNQQL